MLFSYEQSIQLYKAICRALFAVPLLAVFILSPVPSTQTAQLSLLILESLLAIVLAVLAMRMREFARLGAAVDPASLLSALKVDLGLVKDRPVPLREVAEALQKETPHRAAPAVRGRSAKQPLNQEVELAVIAIGPLATRWPRTRPDHGRMRPHPALVAVIAVAGIVLVGGSEGALYHVIETAAGCLKGPSLCP